MTEPESKSGEKRCLLLSDFNLRNLAGYLRREAALSEWKVEETEFGQVIPLLLDATHALWQRETHLAIVWTRAEAVSESFGKVMDGQRVEVESLLAEVDRFATMVAELSSRVRIVAVPTWTTDPAARGLGILDLRPGGRGHAISRMNQRLADRLAEYPNVFLLDASRWLRADGKEGVSPKYWYLSKTPFGLGVFSAAADEIQALVDAVHGRSKKLLILDLDDTLWGGLVGEVGWTGLRLGGHDAVGEAFKDFQRGIKALQRRGVILGIVSKNDEATAMTAVEKHPDMLLRRDDFAGWRINWNDKAQNIVQLAHELNLGLDATVFIDDSPAERGRVVEALPEILVPHWPSDKTEYRRALESLSCFDTVSISLEDSNRTNSYVAQRMSAREQSTMSLEAWLTSLELTVRTESFSRNNAARVAQLLNKTNQFNLSTRRLTEQELTVWTKDTNHRLWVVSVKDRYADHGITGIVSIAILDGECWLVDFVLSCRVFGRNIESVMLELAIDETLRRGATRLSARYLKTEKNAPTLEFLESRSGFERKQASPGTFSWAPDRRPSRAPYIRVISPVNSD